MSSGQKVLDVCTDGSYVLYRFGKTGQTPEIELLDAVRTVNYTPWAGVSSSIWESVSFNNGDYTYEAYSSTRRNTDAPDVAGGVEVSQSGKNIASLQCDAGSVETNIDALFGLREDAGLCYDYPTFRWKECQ